MRTFPSSKKSGPNAARTTAQPKNTAIRPRNFSTTCSNGYFPGSREAPANDTRVASRRGSGALRRRVASVSQGAPFGIQPRCKSSGKPQRSARCALRHNVLPACDENKRDHAGIYHPCLHNLYTNRSCKYLRNECGEYPLCRASDRVLDCHRIHDYRDCGDLSCAQMAEACVNGENPSQRCFSSRDRSISSETDETRQGRICEYTARRSESVAAEIVRLQQRSE